MTQKLTPLDKLRARGALLELISNYLVSKNGAMAEQIFQANVIEHVYDRLEALYEGTCIFATSDMLKVFKGLDQLFLYKTECGDMMPVAKVESEDRTFKTKKHLSHSILVAIECVSTDIAQEVRSLLREERARAGDGSAIFYIIPSQSSVSLRLFEKGLRCSAHIALCIDVIGKEDRVPRTKGKEVEARA